MAWGLWRRFSPLKKLRDYALGTDQREMQRRSDLYRLFLYTSLRERLLGGGAGAVGAGGGQQLAAFAEELAEQVGSAVAAGLPNGGFPKRRFAQGRGLGGLPRWVGPHLRRDGSLLIAFLQHPLRHTRLRTLAATLHGLECVGSHDLHSSAHPPSWPSPPH